MLVGGSGVEASQQICSHPRDHSELGFIFLVICGRLSLAITHSPAWKGPPVRTPRALRSGLSEHPRPRPVREFQGGSRSEEVLIGRQEVMAQVFFGATGVPRAKTTQQFQPHQSSKNAPTIQSYTTQKGMYQCGVSA